MSLSFKAPACSPLNLSGVTFADVLFAPPLAPGSACVAAYSPVWLLPCMMPWLRVAQVDSGCFMVAQGDSWCLGESRADPRLWRLCGGSFCPFPSWSFCPFPLWHLCGVTFADVLFALPLAPGSSCVAAYSLVWLLPCVMSWLRVAQVDSLCFMVAQGDSGFLDEFRVAPRLWRLCRGSTLRSDNWVAPAPRRRPNWCPNARSPASLLDNGGPAVGLFVLVLQGSCLLATVSLWRSVCWRTLRVVPGSW